MPGALAGQRRNGADSIGHSNFDVMGDKQDMKPKLPLWAVIILAVLFGMIFGASIAKAYENGVNVKPIATYSNCIAAGSTANQEGYLSMSQDFTCKEGTIRLKGKWGEDIQEGWRYHTELGKLTTNGEFIGDLPTKDQMPSFQKWCKTKYGYSLCGWNEKEDAEARAKQKLESHHVPNWRQP